MLQDQHRKGRGLTEAILQLSTPAALENDRDRRKLGNSLRLFVRMYEPHEAREDTVLFPAFRKLVSAAEYASIGMDFERKEHELFGEEGFKNSVNEVAAIEKSLGLYDLSQFTPAGE